MVSDSIFTFRSSVLSAHNSVLSSAFQCHRAQLCSSQFLSLFCENFTVFHVNKPSLLQKIASVGNTTLSLCLSVSIAKVVWDMGVPAHFTILGENFLERSDCTNEFGKVMVQEIEQTNLKK